MDVSEEASGKSSLSRSTAPGSELRMTSKVFNIQSKTIKIDLQICMTHASFHSKTKDKRNYSLIQSKLLHKSYIAMLCLALSTCIYKHHMTRYVICRRPSSHLRRSIPPSAHVLGHGADPLLIGEAHPGEAEVADLARPKSRPRSRSTPAVFRGKVHLH